MNISVLNSYPLTFVSNMVKPSLRLYILLLSVFASFHAAYGQKASTGVKLLDSQFIDIGNNTNYQGFATLDSAIQQSRLILLGVNHDYDAFNLKFEIKFIKYLREKHGVNRYLMAIAPSRAMLIQRYISGDSSVEVLLKSLSTPKFMKHYRNLRKYNLKLAAKDRMHVYGIDIEKNINIPAVFIADLLKGDTIPQRIRIGVEAIRGASSYIITKGLEDYDRIVNGKSEESYYYQSRPFSVRYSVEEFGKYFDSLKPEFKAWVGEKNFLALEEAYGWLKQYNQWRTYESTAFEDVWREDVIHTNTVKYLEQFSSEKFFCRWGRCHLSLQEMNGPCNFYQFSALARRLTTGDKPLAILSLPIFYTRIDQMVTDMSDEPKVFKDELKQLASGVPYGKAQFISGQRLDSFPNLKANYHCLLIENGYAAIEFDDDTAETNTELFKKANSYKSDSRMYLGYGRQYGYYNWTNVNNSLTAAGLPSVKNVYGHDFALQFNIENGMFLRYNGGYARGVNNSYAMQRYGMSIAGNTLVDASEVFKLNLGYTFGWQQHSIKDSVANQSFVFISDVKLPNKITNPNLLTGAFMQFLVDLKTLYISAELGYNYDVSDRRWRNNGKFVGGVGSMRGSHWYWNIGAGISLPINTESTYGGDY